MVKLLTIFLALLTLISCSESSSNKESELLKKENELLRRELELEKKSNKTVEKVSASKQSKEDAVIKILGLQSQLCESYSFESNGDIKFDLGSASAGRCKFNLHRVDLSYELRPEEPGCADICPPRLLLKIKCKVKDCISDPSIEDINVSESIIAFYNIEKGKELVIELQRFQKEHN